MSKQYRGLVVGLVNQKVGVAKTTSAAALASIFAERDYKVLAIDNDPQGHLGMHFGIDSVVNKDLPGTTADLYTCKKTAEEIAVRSNFNDVWLIPASTDELSLVEMYLPTRKGSDLQLRSRLKAVRPQFDLIILDAPPNLGKLSINVLAASDWLLVPVEGPLGLRSLDTIV
jgi:chromosome partitioning protein